MTLSLNLITSFRQQVKIKDRAKNCLKLSLRLIQTKFFQLVDKYIKACQYQDQISTG